jgi:DNA-binding LytR/AlgR family response regulator
MRTIIIEDEEYAARRLENLIRECDPSIEIVAKLQSVKESVAWFKSNVHPDLIFLDIQLEDDLSFAIFEQVKVQSKIIFTTAYDEYAIKAFKLKSIDYLLKPINKEELCQAILKYKQWDTEKNVYVDPVELRKLLLPNQPAYRDRFLVTVGEKLKSIHVDDIAYFFSTSGITFVVMNSKSQYSVDMSLDTIKEQLNPEFFFRINRQYFVRLSAIANVIIYPKSRLKVVLNPSTDETIFVSLEKVPDFKRWMDGEKVNAV